MAWTSGLPTKTEPIEEGVIHEIDMSMQLLINEADAYLSRLENRQRSSTENISSGGSSFDSSYRSSTGSMNQPQQDSIVEIDTTAIDDDVSSTNSDDTIFYSVEEPPPPVHHTVQSSPIVIEDDSIVGPSVRPANTLRSRRRRRRLELEEANVSVIDLCSVPSLPSFSSFETVDVLSSGEEDNVVGSAERTRPMVPRGAVPLPMPLYTFALVTAQPSGSFDSTDVRIIESNTFDVAQHHTYNSRAAAAPVSSEPSAAPSRPAVNPAVVVTSTPPQVTSPPRSQVICPICYEPLTNRPATSTQCGHIFCTECLKQSLKHAKKCPICKKPTRPSQMHPVYLTTE